MSDTPWDHFWRHELECRCGCGQMNMDDSFMLKLVDVREAYGSPMIITSGYRCPEHDDTFGGHRVHTTGHAVDVAISRTEAFNLLVAVMRPPVEFRGLGFKQHGGGRFIHLDDLEESPRPNLWSYQ